MNAEQARLQPTLADRLANPLTSSAEAAKQRTQARNAATASGMPASAPGSAISKNGPEKKASRKDKMSTRHHNNLEEAAENTRRETLRQQSLPPSTLEEMRALTAESLAGNQIQARSARKARFSKP